MFDEQRSSSRMRGPLLRAVALTFLCTGFAAIAAEPSTFFAEPIEDAARERAALLDAFSIASGPGTTAYPQIKLPPGDYTLCGLAPAKVYRSMVGGVSAPNATVSAVLTPWRGYVLKSAGSLQPWKASDTELEATIRSKIGIDQSIRSLIGRYGIGEPTASQNKIYQAALWATSCLIDRQNSVFVRKVLTTVGWPNSPSPGAEGASTHSFFILFQHAVLGQRETERFVASAGAAFRRKQLSGEDYARIEDRFLENAKGYQLYGTSTSILPEGEIIDNLLGCRSDTNRRRALIKLPPIKANAKLRQFGGGLCA